MNEQTEQAQETQTPAAVAASEAAPVSLLDSIVDETRVARSDSERARAKDLIGELVTEVLEGGRIS
jgi:type VI secretion system protein ImpC